ncbi:MAG: hypothetical protein GX050_02695 [Firmicutes bacterium]|nr:hypothetical protein [Bacillota bacterium]
MVELSKFIDQIAAGQDLAALKQQAQADPALGIYPASLHEAGGTVLFMVKTATEKKLVAVGDDGPIFAELSGEESTEQGLKVKTCDLTVENSLVIRKYFAFTNPRSLANEPTSFGVGDRLGLASPGHLRLFKEHPNVRPVLAQQSVRELNLTGRDFRGVLADAVWAVFQEDYRLGYGADGDHLKELADIKTALDEGYTMITLDCSEHINNLHPDQQAEIDRLYDALAPEERAKLEEHFSGKTFNLKTGLSLTFTPEALKLNAAIYQKAVNFALRVFNEFIKPVQDRVDFEVSIDETATPTDPLSHFFVAEQLINAGVKVNSMAPRFCGEFQKGIDYIGDVKQFEAEYIEHTKIAEHFGYKVSIHSGSDKFAVFPIIGRISKGHVHVKTAGTNWLEAVKVIIAADPGLYREMHEYALKHLEEAKKYYVISGDPERIPALSSLSDAELPELMEKDDSRQLIHITYGLLLQAKDENGQSLFRDRIYQCLHQNEDLYAEFLKKHIGKHLELLGF